MYQKEKLLLKTGASILRQVGAGSSGEHSSVLPRSPIKTPQLNNSLNSHNSSRNYNPTKTYGLMANDLFSKAASAKGSKGVCTVCKIAIFARNGVGHNSQMIALKMAISSNIYGSKKFV